VWHYKHSFPTAVTEARHERLLMTDRTTSLSFTQISFLLYAAVSVTPGASRGRTVPPIFQVSNTAKWLRIRKLLMTASSTTFHVRTQQERMFRAASRMLILTARPSMAMTTRCPGPKGLHVWSAESAN
jgi:hypothetical protein